MKSKRTRFGRCLAMALSLFSMVFTFLLSPFCAVKSLAAEVNRGENIPYNRYLPGATYSTHMYTVDGKTAYCIESEKEAVPSGTIGDGSDLGYGTAPMLVLALHYGYGGEGAWQMKRFFRERFGITLSDEQQYLYTHIVANYAYVGANMSSTPSQFYKGLSAEIAEASGINEWIRFLGRVLGGSADYTGKTVYTGNIRVFGTSSQTIAVMGSITYNSDTPTPPVEEKENVGKVSVTKTGESLTAYTDGSFVWEEKGLKGARFTVTAKEAIVSKGNTIHEKDAVVGNFETDETGTGSLTDLYPGEYLISEDEAPFGYRKTTEPIPFTLSNEGSDVSLMTKSIPVSNERKKLKLNLTKTDASSGSVLSGAKFGLYTTADILSYDGNVLVPAGSLLKEATSGTDGKIAFAMDLPIGQYEVKELNAPYGYVLSNDVFAIDFNGQAEEDMTASHTFSNAEAKGKLVITKEGESLTGYEDGEFVYETTALEGAEFDLFYGDAEEATAHLVTDENGKATAENLEFGNYKLVETTAPYGMVLNETPVEFSVEYAGQTTPVVVKEQSVINERQLIGLTIEKKENGTDNKLSGGKFSLYTKADIVNAKGEVIVPKDTLLKETVAKEGEVNFGLDLPHGEYTVKETEAIFGFQKNDQSYDINAKYGEVSDNGIHLTILNSRIPKETPEPTPEQPSKVLGATKNNYVTEDEGKDGYSVLIRRAGQEDEKEVEPAMAGFSIGYGVLLVLTGGGLFIARKFKADKEGEKE